MSLVCALGDTDVFGARCDVSVDVGVLGALADAGALGYI